MIDNTYRFPERTLLIDGKTGKPIIDSGEAGGFTENQLMNAIGKNLSRRIFSVTTPGFPLRFYVYDRDYCPCEEAVVHVTDQAGREYVAVEEEPGVKVAVVDDLGVDFTVYAEMDGVRSETLSLNSGDFNEGIEIILPIGGEEGEEDE